MPANNFQENIPDQNSFGSLSAPDQILKQQPQSVNPASDINFQMVISKCPATQYYCQSVGIPGFSIPVANQDTPSLSVPDPGTGITFEKLSVEFLVDTKYQNYMEIQKWLREISEPLGAEKSNYPQKSKNLFSDIHIRVLDNFNNSNFTIRFWRAFPISISTLKLDSTDPGIKYLTCNVEFAFTFYDFE